MVSTTPDQKSEREWEQALRLKRKSSQNGRLIEHEAIESLITSSLHLHERDLTRCELFQAPLVAPQERSTSDLKSNGWCKSESLVPERKAPGLQSPPVRRGHSIFGGRRRPRPLQFRESATSVNIEVFESIDFLLYSCVHYNRTRLGQYGHIGFTRPPPPVLQPPTRTKGTRITPSLVTGNDLPILGRDEPIVILFRHRLHPFWRRLG